MVYVVCIREFEYPLIDIDLLQIGLHLRDDMYILVPLTGKEKLQHFFCCTYQATCDDAAKHVMQSHSVDFC